MSSVHRHVLRATGWFQSKVGFLVAGSILILLVLPFLRAAHARPTAPADGFLASVGVQAIDYPVPDNAIFVAPVAESDPSNSAPFGSESNTGSTPDSPWPVAKALTEAPSSATIVFRGGIYRLGEIRFNKNYTLQPYQDERPILKGSQVVTDWTPDGDTWSTSWDYHFDPDKDDFDNLRRDDVDMVWVNNTMLTPVESRGEVEAGTFFMDEPNDMLYIGTDPAGKTIEVTRYAHSLERVEWNLGGVPGGFDETGLTVRGLTFTHYAVDGFWTRAAEAVLEHNRFINNSQRGLLVYDSDHIIRNNEISGNRIKGANFPYAHNTLFENNLVRNNSFEGLDSPDNRIAVKFGFTDGATIRHNLVENNGANGIWLDVGANDNTIVNNLVRNNGNAGIHFEISDNALIAGNVVVNNDKGIMVTIAANGRIYNNTLVGNSQALHIVEYFRDDSDAMQGPGNAANTTVVNNIFYEATVTDWPWALVTVRSGLCGDWNLVTEMDHNAYYRASTEQPRDTIRWDNEPDAGPAKTECRDQSQKPYRMLPDFQAAHSFEQDSFEVIGDSSQFFVDVTAGNYHLREGSPAIQAGASLPTDIATALGWPTGEAVDIGALQSGFAVAEPGLTDEAREALLGNGRNVYLPFVSR